MDSRDSPVFLDFLLFFQLQIPGFAWVRLPTWGIELEDQVSLCGFFHFLLKLRGSFWLRKAQQMVDFQIRNEACLNPSTSRCILAGRRREQEAHQVQVASETGSQDRLYHCGGGSPPHTPPCRQAITCRGAHATREVHANVRGVVRFVLFSFP